MAAASSTSESREQSSSTGRGCTRAPAAASREAACSAFMYTSASVGTRRATSPAADCEPRSFVMLYKFNNKKQYCRSFRFKLQTIWDRRTAIVSGIARAYLMRVEMRARAQELAQQLGQAGQRAGHQRQLHAVSHAHDERQREHGQLAAGGAPQAGHDRRVELRGSDGALLVRRRR